MGKNILFDLDGTLTDPKVGIVSCIRHALDQMNVAYPGSLDWCIGPPIQDTFAEILKTDDKLRVDQAIALYRARFKALGMFENFVYPEIPALLERLTKGEYHLFVATSKPVVFATQIIEYFNLSRFFKGIFGSELDGRNSDKGTLIASILTSQKLEPGGTFMIGDRKYDIIGAKKNNIRSIGVLWGYGNRAELTAAGADHIVRTPGEIISLV